MTEIEKVQFRLATQRIRKFAEKEAIQLVKICPDIGLSDDEISLTVGRPCVIMQEIRIMFLLLKATV